MPRGDRRRGYILHLTGINNLASIWREGAIIATSRIPAQVTVDELGSRDIKQQRATREVPCSKGGVVADYVPFYYSARSPMLYFAHTGNPLSPFKQGQGELVHLVSHIEVVNDLGLDFAITDRNAALRYADYSADLGDLDRLVDWTLQARTYWSDTDGEPDRTERRMAEFLVYDTCPVTAILGIVAIDEAVEKRVSDVLAGYDHPAVRVERSWYY